MPGFLGLAQEGTGCQEQVQTVRWCTGCAFQPKALEVTQTSNNNNHHHNKNNNSTQWFAIVSNTLHLLPLSPPQVTQAGSGYPALSPHLSRRWLSLPHTVEGHFISFQLRGLSDAW